MGRSVFLPGRTKRRGFPSTGARLRLREYLPHATCPYFAVPGEFYISDVVLGAGLKKLQRPGPAFSGGVVVAHLKTIQKFELWRCDPGNVEELFRLLVDERMSLRNAAFALKQPYTCVYPMVHDGGEMQARYEAALKAKADEMSHERLEIADAVKGTEKPAQVMAAKLRCDVRESLASKWDRERYGEKQDGHGSGNTYVFQIAPLHDADFEERVVNPEAKRLIE